LAAGYRQLPREKINGLAEVFGAYSLDYEEDFFDVKGQENVKRGP